MRKLREHDRHGILSFEMLEKRHLLTAMTTGAVVAGFNSFTLAANDDGSSNQVSIGFALNFFGSKFDHLWVNNNGNVTFTAALGEYTPFGLTGMLNTPIIAPFFADVDTRGEGSGVVTYGAGEIDGHLAFGVNYPDVGYYDEQTDKLNSFQLILIDRPDRGTGPTGDDFDIEFNYNQIQWETGEASGGSDGLGGTSAAVGFSKGTGEPGTYFQLNGSFVNGAFLDSNPQTGLIHNSDNSSIAGQYIISIHNGVALPLTVVPPANQATSEGVSHLFNLGSFSDPGAGPWTVDVNWGDGTPDTVFLATPGPLGVRAHTYTSGGDSTVTVKVTDGFLSSGQATFQVAVGRFEMPSTDSTPSAVNEPTTAASSPALIAPSSATSGLVPVTTALPIVQLQTPVPGSGGPVLDSNAGPENKVLGIVDFFDDDGRLHGGGAPVLEGPVPDVVLVQFQSLVPEVEIAELSDARPDPPDVPKLIPTSGEDLTLPEAPLATSELTPTGSWRTIMISGIAIVGSLSALLGSTFLRRRGAANRAKSTTAPQDPIG